jgi:hypothetical protein
LTDRTERVVLWAVLGALGVISPLAQAVAQNFVYEADPTNPYVYGHTHTDIFTVSDELHALIRSAPEGQVPTIQVVCPGKDYWPLPWYLRDYAHVGYWSAVDMNEPPGDVIVFQPSVAADVTRLIDRFPDRELYYRLFKEPLLLRPGVPLEAYVRKSLWDALVVCNSHPDGHSLVAAVHLRRQTSLVPWGPPVSSLYLTYWHGEITHNSDYYKPLGSDTIE